MGISPEAVRNRLSRGTLRSVKENGTVYVLLKVDRTGRTRHTGDTSADRPPDMSRELLEKMRGRIEALQKQLEQANERDREDPRYRSARIPERSAEMPMGPVPSEPPEEAQRAAEQAQYRSLWREFLGF